MKTVHMLGGARVEVVDAPEPVAGPGEVVVQTVFSALCGSELHTYRGKGLAAGNGGHEAAGTVVAVGPGVTDLVPGRRVGVSAVVGCGTCPECREGRYTWCDQVGVFTHMHAERFVIPARACHLLPDDVPWEVGVLLSGDGLGVPYHSYQKVKSAAVRTVAVLGVGPIGLGNVLVEARAGRRVIAVDLVDYRLERARKLGADLALKGGDDLVARLRAATDGVGVDVAIEAAGKPETLRQCFGVVCKGGTVLINGEQDVDLLSPSRDFIRRDITAVGSWFYHFHEFADMLALYRQGLPIRDLITHTFPLAAADEAYRAFAAGQTGKALLRPGQG